MSVESLIISDGFDCEITHVQNGVKTVLLDMGSYTQKIKAEFSGATLKFNSKLEQLDFTYELPGLAKAPLPELSDLESRAERSTILLQQWERYPTVGIALFTAFGGGFWTRAGMMPIQNHGMENWQLMLQPVLTTTNEVFLLGEKTKIAIQVIDTGDGLLRPNGDKLTIRGTFTSQVSIYEKKQKMISDRRSFGVNLVDGFITQVLSFNPSRKYIYLTNTGNVPVQFVFGTPADLAQGAVVDESGKVIQTNGLLLTPSGAANFEMNGYVEGSPISAVAIGGDARITLIEGW